ncbi:hypothetical protein H6P81_008475 [Aristolochia fimbriata]|uniref:DUF7894 domain-containing protein n=1 Tax=Aristolochia fimbriata TaxID=158543 RepID=A0AAV7EK87_ARIFI|nr:hypothetical protein H6P81_008475 [Aristolochia fimbriata]
MRVASKVIFLVKDRYGDAILDALQPSPSACLRKEEFAFDLSLEKYGVKDQKASGKVVNFVDDQKCPKVSIVLLHNYKPPIVACAVFEVLIAILSDSSSNAPEFLLPIVASSLELKFIMKLADLSLEDQNATVYGAQFGPLTDFIKSMLSKIRKLPSDFQVASEPLACLLQVARALELPTVLIVGSGSADKKERPTDQELETLFNVLEFTASHVGFSVSKDLLHLTTPQELREHQEPWRAWYA